MSREYCEVCNDFVSYKIVADIKKRIVDNLIVEYEYKKCICDNCSNEFYNEEIIDYNVSSYNNAYNKIFDCITTKEINLILNKYDIGKKPLSKILNWGDVTIIRYLNGQVPDKAHSDILKSILNSPIIMKNYLEKNKKNISSVAYKKVFNKLKQYELKINYSKIYIVSNYIIDKTEDITLLALQKILYFIQGFSKVFLEKNMFENNCEAWVNGPVFRDIYDSYSNYRYNIISEKEDFNYTKYLTKEEINLIDEIIKYFGCYSGEILKEMTHLTIPWQKGRIGKSALENSSTIINIELINKYFSKISKEYKINNICDIYKYSSDIFNKIIGKID